MCRIRDPGSTGDSSESVRRIFLFIFLFLSLLLKCPATTEGDIPAAQLAAILKHGQLIKETEDKFRMDAQKPKNVSMYYLTNAVFWTADMDIDCDGRETT